MELTKKRIEGLGVALNEATLLGIEVNQDQRTARLTFDVLTLPRSGPASQGTRVQILLAPVGRVVASLRHGRWDDPNARVEPFTIEQLLSVVQRFGGQPVYGGEFFDLPDSEFAKWSSRASLDFQTDVNGRRHTLDLFQEGNDLHLDVRLWFDGMRISMLDGTEISIDEFIASGKRWWDAFYKQDPRTRSRGMFPLDDKR